MENRRNMRKLSPTAARRVGTLGLAGGVLAPMLAAEAGINYFNISPDETVQSATFSLDVDGPFGGDAGAELQFAHLFPGPATNFFGNASAQPVSASAFIAGFMGATYKYVSNPASGALIAAMNTASTELVAGTAFSFGVISSGVKGRMAVAAEPTNTNLKFMSGAEGFLAFKFQESTSGKVGFGWAKVTVSHPAGGPIDQNTITLQEYAWSTDTDISVGQIPEPGAIGLLALGAAGISLMRRRSQARDHESEDH